MKRVYIYMMIALCGVSACTSSRQRILGDTRLGLVDKHATDLTATLLHNLKQTTGKYVVYGQHNYEVDGFDSDTSRRRDEQNRCDAYDVTGVYPAMASFDSLHLTNPVSWETESLGYIKSKFYVAYERGNVFTFYWHHYNLATGNNFYDITQAVKHTLPDGPRHKTFKSDLKTIADFAHNAKNHAGELIPIIFRPRHEFGGNWFWWGRSHCIVEEFKEPYRFTVTYLRDSLQVHNFLYAFSPDYGFMTEKELLERHLGDEYVDVVGMDNYWDFRSDGGDASLVVLKFRILTKYVRKHNKLFAITETGTQTRDSLQYSQLLNILYLEGVGLNCLCTWSGFVPYKGRPAASDFYQFKEDSLILFVDEASDFYVPTK